MKTITVKNLKEKEIKIRYNDQTGHVHNSDYEKINRNNFKLFKEADGENFYKVGDLVIRKTLPTFLDDGYCCVFNPQTGLM